MAREGRAALCARVRKQEEYARIMHCCIVLSMQSLLLRSTALCLCEQKVYNAVSVKVKDNSPPTV